MKGLLRTVGLCLSVSYCWEPVCDSPHAGAELFVSFLSRRPGGGGVLQHHPTDQTDQGEDRGAGLQSYAGIHRTVFL